MTAFLASINDYIAAAVIIIAGIAVSLFAGDLPLNMGKKLLWISIVIGLWMALVEPYQVELQKLGIYMLSIFVYSVITEDSAIFISQAVMFLLTFKLTIWFLDIQTPESKSELERAPGFTSKRV